MPDNRIRALPVVFGLALTVGVLAGCRAPQEASSGGVVTPICGLGSLPTLPSVRILSVTAEGGGAPHCRVSGVIGTETNFELLLPDDWNGKFVMGGGGGFVGSVINTALGFGPLQAGYATAGTDTGHRGHPLDARWALNNLERIVSFGHQAVHRTAVTSQALIAGYYGRESSADYFFGCSRGGGQALMEAQRYPGDFDGIVAGAPALNWTHELGARNTWVNQIMFPDPSDLSVATISPDEVQLIGNAVLERCDALDGLEDGILNNPLACRFDVSSLACEVGATEGCLSDLDVEAARRIYDDLYLHGERIFPGMPPGGELGPGGWSRWLTGGLEAQGGVGTFQEGVAADAEFPAPVTPNAHWAFGNGVMKYLVMHDPDWDYTEYDFETFESDVAAVAPTLNAIDADLTEFRKQGGKLLMFTGWGDMALSPLGTIEYYEKLLEHDPGASDDVRLMMMPGVDHCFGGVGPYWVNWVEEIDRWVETDVAPEYVTAYWLDEQGQPDGSRPVCAYPDRLEYHGTGDPRNAASFSCLSSDQVPG